jgi:pimeloyl-ACP methyl ester carboxylesterase
MQSSSKLFPVALISAELRNALSEDVYLLKPSNSPDYTVELALTRLGLAAHGETRGVPVILLHGSFSNRRFWYSPRGIGLGPYLAQAGFDVWIAEMRGHGLSPRNNQYRRNTVADYARYDLPAISAFVREQSGQVPHWLGHSLGGVTLAAALGGQYMAAQEAASVAIFGSQVSRTFWPLKIPPLQWALHLLLTRCVGLSGSRLQRGPEDEPAGIAQEQLRWHALFGRFAQGKNDWWRGLAQVQVPLLAVAAEGDVQDPLRFCRQLFEQFGSPSRHFLSLGKRHGYTEDYGHSEMLLNQSAQAEVWPLIVHWLQHGQVPEDGALAPI